MEPLGRAWGLGFRVCFPRLHIRLEIWWGLLSQGVWPSGESVEDLL